MSYKDYMKLDFDQNRTTFKRYRERIEFIKPYVNGTILDIGGENHFSKVMKGKLRVPIDNTTGDIDYGINAPLNKYNLIICSHIIEHVMNPLVVMNGIREHLSGKAIIIYPTTLMQLKGCWHFHEIPPKDMKNLIEKAKLKIERWEVKRFQTGWFGIRPLIRKIFYKEHFIVVK